MSIVMEGLLVASEVPTAGTNVRVAGSGDPVPGSNYTIATPRRPLLNIFGDVAFCGNTSQASGNKSGIFKWSCANQTLATVVFQGDSVGALTIAGLYSAPAFNDSGQLAFLGAYTQSGTKYGLFTWPSSGNVAAAVLNGDAAPVREEGTNPYYTPNQNYQPFLSQTGAVLANCGIVNLTNPYDGDDSIVLGAVTQAGVSLVARQNWPAYDSVKFYRSDTNSSLPLCSISPSGNLAWVGERYSGARWGVFV